MKREIYNYSEEVVSNFDRQVFISPSIISEHFDFFDNEIEKTVKMRNKILLNEALGLFLKVNNLNLLLNGEKEYVDIELIGGSKVEVPFINSFNTENQQDSKNNVVFTESSFRMILLLSILDVYFDKYTHDLNIVENDRHLWSLLEDRGITIENYKKYHKLCGGYNENSTDF